METANFFIGLITLVILTIGIYWLRKLWRSYTNENSSVDINSLKSQRDNWREEKRYTR